MEQWKDILGYNGKYSISSYGRVRSNKKSVIMSPCNDKDGYVLISLYKDKKKTCKIHRLVALNFIPNPLEKPTVNHKDGNKGNNNVLNLEWNTRKENTNHGYNTKLIFNYGLNNGNGRLSDETIKLIKEATGTYQEIANTYKISKGYVSKLKNGHRR